MDTSSITIQPMPVNAATLPGVHNALRACELEATKQIAHIPTPEGQREFWGGLAAYAGLNATYIATNFGGAGAHAGLAGRTTGGASGG
jgi:hypothetical protein